MPVVMNRRARYTLHSYYQLVTTGTEDNFQVKRTMDFGNGNQEVIRISVRKYMQL